MKKRIDKNFKLQLQVGEKERLVKSRSRLLMKKKWRKYLERNNQGKVLLRGKRLKSLHLHFSIAMFLQTLGFSSQGVMSGNLSVSKRILELILLNQMIELLLWKDQVRS